MIWFTKYLYIIFQNICSKIKYSNIATKFLLKILKLSLLLTITFSFIYVNLQKNLKQGYF